MNNNIFTSVAIGLVTVLATASLLDEPSAHDVEQSVQLDLRDAQRQAERVARSGHTAQAVCGDANAQLVQLQTGELACRRLA